MPKPWSFEICEVCWWQDDGQNDENADEQWGGANKNLSLTEARVNFRKLGACRKEYLEHTRPPKEDEHPK